MKSRHHLRARLLLLAVLVAPVLAAPVYKAGYWMVIDPAIDTAATENKP